MLNVTNDSNTHTNSLGEPAALQLYVTHPLPWKP